MTEKGKSNWYTLCQGRLRIYIKEDYSTVKEIMHHSLPEETMQSYILEALIVVKKNRMLE